MTQNASRVLMVRPANFGYNLQTAGSNSFQHTSAELPSEIIKIVINEFDHAVEMLRENEVEVWVIDDTPNPIKPDAIFPNNWISFAANGEVYIYPMLTPNRQAEIRLDLVGFLSTHFKITKVVHLENDAGNRCLEGTGSMVFDHQHQIAYAALSERTDQSLFEEYCQLTHYTPVSFVAVDLQGLPIYHTNVMMCIGSGFVVICLESIKDPEQRKKVKKSLVESGLEIIEISFLQALEFAGNMLALKNNQEGQLLIMSESAYQSLNPEQLNRMKRYARIISIPIPHIEEIGGGGIRCMLAEIFCEPIRE